MRVTQFAKPGSRSASNFTMRLMTMPDSRPFRTSDVSAPAYSRPETVLSELPGIRLRALRPSIVQACRLRKKTRTPSTTPHSRRAVAFSTARSNRVAAERVFVRGLQRGRRGLKYQAVLPAPENGGLTRDTLETAATPGFSLSWRPMSRIPRRHPAARRTSHVLLKLSLSTTNYTRDGSKPSRQF